MNSDEKGMKPKALKGKTFGKTIQEYRLRKNKLNRLRSRLPKERVQGGMSRMSGIVEYEYSNYDIKQAEADYAAVSDELARAQNALDAVNASVTFSVEME